MYSKSELLEMKKELLTLNSDEKSRDTYNVDIVKDYFSKSHPELLTESEEKALFKRLEQGDTVARNTIIERNLRLVSAIALKYLNYGLPLEDLIQEGNIGLIMAVDKFDISYENRFSTYATYWIKQTITYAIENKSRIVRIPNHMYAKRNEYYKALKTLANEGNHAPTDEEVAKKMNVKVEAVKNIKTTFQTEYSLDAETEDGLSLADVIEDDNITFEEDIVKEEKLIEIVEKFLAKKKTQIRDLEVLKMHYGFMDDKVYTFKEIASALNISVSNVDRRDKTTLKKLRKVPEINKYREYL